MKRAALSTAALAALLLGTSLPGQAATLLGDTISFLRSYPTTTTQFGNAIPDTTVTAGSSDVVGWSYGSNPVYATFDPEATSITFNFASFSTMGTGAGVFDGFVVSGINADIVSLSVLSNSTTYGVALLTNNGHGFDIGFSGGGGPGSVVIGLQFASTVPEPATAALAFAGLALFGLKARRRRE